MTVLPGTPRGCEADGTAKYFCFCTDLAIILRAVCPLQQVFLGAGPLLGLQPLPPPAALPLLRAAGRGGFRKHPAPGFV